MLHAASFLIVRRQLLSDFVFRSDASSFLVFCFRSTPPLLLLLSLFCLAMRPGYESDSSDSSSEDILQLILDEEEELRRQKKRKLQKVLLLATLTLSVGLHDEHNQHFYRDRLKWMEHVSHLNAEGPNAFFAMYRMHYPAYMKLCDLIDQSVRKNFEMAKLRTGNTVGAITTPIALHCCLR